MDISYLETTALLAPPIDPLFILSTGGSVCKAAIQSTLKEITFQNTVIMVLRVQENT